MPVFSVVIPNYNYEDYLPEAVESVLAQSFADFEVIVVDDCSKDESLDRISSLTDDRLVTIRTAVNSGVAAALNLGMDRATGDYIAVLGGDDRYRPEFLQRQYDFLTANPAIDISGTYMHQIDTTGARGKSRRMERWFNMSTDLNDPESWVWANRLNHSSTVVRASVLERAGRYDPSIRITVDWNYWIRCLSLGLRFSVIPSHLSEVRWHGRNMTGRNQASMLRSHARTSYMHFHPFLESLGRRDLVAYNVRGFLTHRAFRECATEEKAQILLELIGSRPDAAPLALGLESIAAELSAARVHHGLSAMVRERFARIPLRS